MSKRFRKLLGAFMMIVFVLVYALVAMAVADSRPMHNSPPLAQSMLYIVLGLAWVLPLMPLIRWMERAEPHAYPRAIAKRPRRSPACTKSAALNFVQQLITWFKKCGQSNLA